MKELHFMRTPWYNVWRKMFLELNRCQMSTMLQQPFALFFIVTTDEDIASSLNTIT